MTTLIRLLGLFCVVVLFTQCESFESLPSTGGSQTISGTDFYPDEVGVTYRVPAGAQIIGAGGTNCKYIIESGGSIVAHSGKGNQYLVKSGGQFRGFVHPATNCTVTYEAGAIIEKEQSGPGTIFKQAGSSSSLSAAPPTSPEGASGVDPGSGSSVIPGGATASGAATVTLPPVIAPSSRSQ